MKTWRIAALGWLAVAVILVGGRELAWAQDADLSFQQGIELFNQGKIDEAIAKYEAGLMILPDFAPGHNLLGMGYRFKYLRTGEASWRVKEIAEFQRAIELDPNFVPALINLGATYLYQGRVKDAAPLFKRALEIYPEHPERELLERYIQEGEKGSE